MNKTANATAMRRKLILFYIAFCMANLISNFCQYQLSPVAVRIMEQYGMTQQQFSSVFTAPMIPAIFLSFLAGLLVDRYGYKYILGFAVFMAFVGAVLRIFVTSYVGLFISMICVGFVGAIFCTSLSKVMGSVYGEEKSGMFVGGTFASSYLAIFIATSTSALFSNLKTLFIVGACVALVSLLSWIFFIPNDRKSATRLAAKPSENAAADSPKLGECLRVAAKNRNVWFVGLILFCIIGCMSVIGSTLSPALMSRGMTELKASFVVTVFMIGETVGALVLPALIAKAGHFRAIVCAMCVVGALGVAFSWQMPVGFLLYACCLITGVCIGAGIAVCVAVTVRLPGIGPKYAGTAGGIATTLQLIGGVCIPTYVVTAIAGTNYTVLFPLSAAFMIVSAVLTVILPKALDAKG